MDRQLRDPFVHAAAADQYRARSSYKLIELLDKYELQPKASACIIDCGAAPGGWSQVLARRLQGAENEEPRIIAVDMLEMQGIRGVQTIHGDFLDAAVKQQIVSAVAGRRVGLVLSDMAPSFTGHRAIDALRTTALCEDVVDFASEFLAPGGALVLKYFMGGEEQELRERLRRMFAQVKVDKPRASRKQSSENYFVCLGRV
ncbi:2' O-ribose methyltransferase [Coemansia sp. RSA 2611]|nr:2' O-ribose methyltransferase [Coemansia sp. RSA 2704]KAJ2327807.1 2' O-ribose methyltransferase [Coemansia sp. RSA 2702]KAJ2368764.1 2' O-ribose methyltransferase [Coemansia sp. RSA 2610]KAJ2391183.1 2' O-ribose methyltransferase [Coemansia sp. RSA 2611]